MSGGGDVAAVAVVVAAVAVVVAAAAAELARPRNRCVFAYPTQTFPYM